MRQQAKKDEYLSGIIHDFRTPTTAQIKALELFLSTGSEKLTQEERELIELTLNSCNHVQTLIETYNSVEKLEHERIRLNYDKFNIVDLFREILCEFAILSKYYEIDIEFNSPDEIIVNADRNQIKKVINHILTNSLNSSFKKSTIKIELSKYKNEFKAQIKSKGNYIEPKVLKEIFEKNKTYKKNIGKVGFNLGFYLSKEIIAAHFGKMIAQSEDNENNIFGFCIPVT